MRLQYYHPTITDVYDHKNMPRVIYCLHALRCFKIQEEERREYCAPDKNPDVD